MKINMNKILIIFILFIFIKCETWYDEVTGHNTNDAKNGYAGSRGNSITAFYLNGDRKYRVHYRGDDKNSWTGEYCCSDPVGIGRPIDGISISGGKKYRVRYKNGNWETPVDGFDIYNSKNGYAGTLGKEIDAILIEGDDGYRVAYGGDSSNVEEVAKRVIKNLFGLNYNYNFEHETTIIDNYYIKVTVILLYEYNYNYKQKINLVIKNNKAVDVNLGDLDTNLLEEIKKVINFDITNLKSKFESSFANGMSNGSVNVEFYWFQKKIVINAGSKITENHHSYRGGYKITIYLKDNFDKLGEKVLAPSQVFLKRLGAVGDMVIAFINNLLNNAIKILTTVIENLSMYMPSFLAAFLGYCLFFIFSLAA